MLDYLYDHANSQPDCEAAVEGGTRVTYLELLNQVVAAGECLLAKGIGAGRVVAYIGPPGIQYLVSLLAAFRCGATWMGLNPKYRAAELTYVIGHSRPCALIVASSVDVSVRAELAGALDSSPVAPVLAIVGAGANGLMEALEGISAELIRLHPPQPEIIVLEAAVLVYTSGSTGKPKGACLTQSNLVENSWWLAHRQDFEAGRSLINLPVNHVGCIADTTLPALLGGHTLVFMATFDAIEAARLARDEGITSLGQVPAQFQLMHAAGVLTKEYLGSVKHLGWGGAAMPQSLIEHLSGLVPDLSNGYGQTECSGTVTITPPGASVEQLANSVGVPVVEGSVQIVDPMGDPVLYGASGEVQVRGAHVFPGYLRNEATTLLALSPAGWLRTGDIGFWRPDGALSLSGRMSEMYKSGGYNIHPREIEALLESHPAVVMAAVIAVADPLWGEVGHAFVVASPDEVDGAALSAFCREHLAAYKVPKNIFVRAELPLLPIGKIDKKRLSDLIPSN
jgi:acyl-CoA synthetase (AMP-forming)/AMP-acid ligase II